MHRVWISMETWCRKQEGDVGKKKALGIQDTVIFTCRGPGQAWGGGGEGCIRRSSQRLNALFFQSEGLRSSCSSHSCSQRRSDAATQEGRATTRLTKRGKKRHVVAVTQVTQQAATHAHLSKITGLQHGFHLLARTSAFMSFNYRA